MAKKSGNKKVASSKSKTKFYLSSTDRVQFDREKVLGWVLPIMKLLDAQHYPAQIATVLSMRPQHVHYYVKKLVDAGLFYQSRRGHVAVYEATSDGKSLLWSCEGNVWPSALHRLDKCQVSFAILQEGCYPDGQFRKVEMVNWTALLGLELGVKVRHTSRSWIVHIPVIRGKSPPEVYGLAMNLANRVALSLAKKYGVVLLEGKFAAGELVVEDPVAKLFGRFFTVRTRHRKIDHSYNEGELENLGKDAAIEYLQMPGTVKKIDARIVRLEHKFERLIDAMGGLGDLEDPKRVVEGQRRIGEYIT
jgi:predicted transcriptional regulator